MSNHYSDPKNNPVVIKISLEQFSAFLGLTTFLS